MHFAGVEKRLIIVIAVVLTALCAVFAVSVPAADYAEAASVTYIASEQEFWQMLSGSTSGGTYSLTQDIHLETLSVNKTAFQGTFDGAGHTIYADNIYLHLETVDPGIKIGIFSELNNAVVKNLTVKGNIRVYIRVHMKNLQIQGGASPSAFGVVAGTAVESAIENVIVDADVDYAGGRAGFAVGGLVGITKSVEIRDTVVDGSILYSASEPMVASWANNSEVAVGGIAGVAGYNSVGSSFERAVCLAEILRGSNIHVGTNGLYTAGLIAKTSGAISVDSCYYTNGFVSNKYAAFPKRNSVTETNCISFATEDSNRWFSDDEEEFREKAKSLYWRTDFFAWRNKLQRTATVDGTKPAKFTVWNTHFDGMPVPSGINDLLSPVSATASLETLSPSGQQETRLFYLVSDSGEFEDMAQGQILSENYKNLNIRLETSVSVTDAFVPFGAYKGAVFDGNGKTITVPGSVTIYAISAALFSNIEASAVRNFTFDFYGTFDAATPTEEYGAKTGNGAYNRAGLIGHASAGEGSYAIENILVNYNGVMQASSKYKISNDSTAARVGALVGEDWHNRGDNDKKPRYSNCLIVWNDGEIKDTASENPNAGVYVRPDIGVFWDGSMQSAVGVIGVWSLIKNSKLASYRGMSGLGGAVGCIVFEEDANTINYSWKDNKMSFSSIAANGMRAVISKEVGGGEVNEDELIYDSGKDGGDYIPPVTDGYSKLILYAYQAAEVSMYEKLDGLTSASPAYTALYRKGAEFDRTFGEQDLKEGYLFYGYDNKSTLTYSKTVNAPFTFAADYYTISDVTEYRTEYNGSHQPLTAPTSYGKRFEYLYFLNNSSVSEVVDKGSYRCLITVYDGDVKVGSKEVSYIVDAKRLIVTPLSGQAKRYNGEEINAADILYFFSETPAAGFVMDGSLGIENNGVAVGYYKITAGDIRDNDGNYTIVFAEGEHYYAILGSTVVIAARSGQSKVYDGTTDAEPEYSVVWDETDPAVEESNLNWSGSLTIGGASAGRHQILIGTLDCGWQGYSVLLKIEYFEVTKRPVAVIPVAGQSKEYDKTSAAEISFFTDGLADDDTTESSFFGALGIGDGRDAGFHPVELGTLSSDNYEITLQPGVMFEIKPKNIIVTPVSGQSKIYDKNAPAEISFTFTAGDGEAFNLPVGDAFSGMLGLDTAVFGAGAYPIINDDAEAGGLTLGNNYYITFVEGVTYEILTREINLIYFKESSKLVTYTPSSAVFDTVRAEVEGLLEGDDTQPYYHLYISDGIGGWRELGSGVKPGTGHYRAVTNGLLSNPNYHIAEGLSWETEFDIAPYQLTKEDFDFPDLIFDFSGSKIAAGIGGMSKGKGYDYPGINYVSGAYEDQNNNTDEGLEDGVPKYAGVYRQRCDYSYDSNYAVGAVGTGGAGVFSVKRNITVNKKLISLNIKYNGSYDKEISYQARRIDISVTAFGNTVTENISLTYTITKDGVRSDYIQFAGVYTLMITFGSGDAYYKKNYCLSDGSVSEESIFIDTFEVKKADPILSRVSATDIKYESSLSVSVITATVTNPQTVRLNGGTFVFADANSVPDAGSVYAKFIYYPSNDFEYGAIKYSDNYNPVEGYVYVNVAPQVIDVVPLSNQSQEYDYGKLGEIRFTATNIADSSRYVFRGEPGVEWASGGDNGYRAGSGYVITQGTLRVVRLDGDEELATENYTVNFTSGVAYTIEKRKVSVEYIGYDDLRYDSAAVSAPDYRVAPVDFLPQEDGANPLRMKISYYRLTDFNLWQRVESEILDGNMPIILEAGYYRIVTEVESADFEIDPAIADFSFSVERQTLDPAEIEFTETEFEYDGTVKSISVITDGLPEDLIFLYRNNENVYTGDYDVEIYITASSDNYIMGGKYLDESEYYLLKKNVVIHKHRIAHIEITNAAQLVYNGSEQRLEIAFEGVRTEDNVAKNVVVRRNGATASPVAAGLYTAEVAIAENPNYEFGADCATTVEFEIKRAKITLEAVTNFVKVYNGNPSIDVQASDLAIKGLYNGDEVALNEGFSAAFEDDLTGTHKKIILSGVTLAGRDAANYEIDYANTAILGDVTAKKYVNAEGNGFDASIVPIKDSNIDLNAEFRAKLIDTGSYDALKKQLLKEKEEIFKIFEYGVYEDGELAEITSPVKMSINGEGSKIKLYKLNEDNTLTEVGYDFNGGYIEFEVSGYDTYVMTVDRVYNSVFSDIFGSPFFYVGVALVLGAFVTLIVIKAKKNRGGGR